MGGCVALRSRVVDRQSTDRIPVTTCQWRASSRHQARVLFSEEREVEVHTRTRSDEPGEQTRREDYRRRIR